MAEKEKFWSIRKKGEKDTKEKMDTGSGIQILKYRISRCQKRKVLQNLKKKKKKIRPYGT